MSRYFLKADAFLQFDPSAKTPDLTLWKKLLGIGLPAGAEFGLMALYLLIVYVISRPFGAAAQAGFGIGLRIIQALFMPVVALGFAVAPVAGQNFGARKGARVIQTFREGALMAGGVMLVCGVVCHWIPGPLIGIFSNDPGVIAVGSEYLRISSWNFIASGIIFVASSTFQAMGNTLPALATSTLRILLVAIPAFIVSRWPGFELRWIWYLSVGSIVLQMTASLLLLRREFRLKLTNA
jgi:Na+-driven multidrug efflux pump